uniref:MEIS N-terminal domain-containing protein n=1 Tax=Macrostomum lignano TaxID=282301 RepID=A0A1I8F3W1_9PLAT
MELRTSIALALTRQQLPATRPHPAPPNSAGDAASFKRRPPLWQRQRQRLQRRQHRHQASESGTSTTAANSCSAGGSPHHPGGQDELNKGRDQMFKHPDVPAAACLIFEKCELATSAPREIGAASVPGGDVCSSQSFEQDIAEFAQRVQAHRPSNFFPNAIEL